MLADVVVGVDNDRAVRSGQRRSLSAEGVRDRIYVGGQGFAVTDQHVAWSETGHPDCADKVPGLRYRVDFGQQVPVRAAV